MVDVTRLVMAVDSRQVRTGRERLDHLTESGGRAENATGRLRSGFATMGSVIRRWLPVLTAAGVALQFRSAVQEQEQLQRNLMRTEQLLRTTGATAWASVDQMRLQAEEMARATLQSTEGIMAAQQTMLTFRNVTGEVFQEALEASVDLASALGTDLNSAVLQVSKALEDPVRGMTALSRSGTVFTDVQREMVREMVEAGEVAQAQKFILQELADQYGGTSKAEAMGFAGAQDTLKQSIQELKIGIMDWLGTGDLMAGWFRRAAEMMDNLTAVFRSGQIDYYLELVAFQFQQMGKDIEHVMTIASHIIGAESAAWKESLDGAFVDMPGNIRDMFEIIILEFQIFVRRLRAYDVWTAGFFDPRTWFSESRRELLRKQLELDLEIIETDWFMGMEEIATRRIDRKTTIEHLLDNARNARAEWERERETFEGFTGDFSRAGAQEQDAGMSEDDRAQIERRLQALRESHMAEEELQHLKYARELEILNEARAAGLMAEETWHEELQEAYSRHEETLSEIHKKGWDERQQYEAMTMKQRASFLSGEMAGILGVFASHNDAMFNVSKIASSGSAFVSTLAGQAEALKLGWPMGPIAAMKIGATGFGFVSAIRNATKGGGASIGSSAAADLSAASVPASSIPQQTFTRLDGGRVMGSGEVTININALDTANAVEYLNDHRSDIVGLIQEEYDSRGRSGGPVS